MSLFLYLVYSKWIILHETRTFWQFLTSPYMEKNLMKVIERDLKIVLKLFNILRPAIKNGL